MGHLSQGIAKGGEIYINKNTYGHQVWERVFKYPDVGIALSFYDYGSDYLGQSIGALFYVNFYIFKKSNWEGIFKLGTGLGYHTNPYDKETNNQNVAIGSTISQSMQMRGGINYKIGPRWKLTTALTLSHFSLAAMTQPNKGINIVTLNAGANYRINDNIPEKIPRDEDYRWSTRIKYNINVNYGLKEIPPIGGPKYPTYVLSFYIDRQISKTNVLNLGIEGFNNTALKEEMKQSDLDPEGIDNKRIGILIGHELKLNRLSLLTHFGVYVYRPYKTDKAVYQRLALKFYITDNLYLHYGFITHFAKADHPEWGIGITL
jgi:hypothetical protein